MHDIRFISAEETYDLRHRILRPHQPIDACHYPQDFDKGNFHLGAFDNDRLVCTGSFYVKSHPTFDHVVQYQLRGMATEDVYQGRGFGKTLMELSFQEIKKRGGGLLWCNARQIAFPFYQKLGFVFNSDLFDIESIGPHKIMSKTIEAS